MEERAVAECWRQPCCSCQCLLLALALVVVCPAASQVASRLITFVLNLLIARHLSPEAYGVGG